MRYHLALLLCLCIAVVWKIVNTPGGVPFLFREHGLLDGRRKMCEAADFKATTLKLLYEIPFALLSAGPASKFEASALVIHPKLAKVYVVFDNLYSVVQLTVPWIASGGDDVTVPGLAARWLQWPDAGDEGDSGFEFMAFNESSGWYVIGKEAVNTDGRWRAQTIDVQFDNGIRLGQVCTTEYEFEKENKGLEGGSIVNIGGEWLMLGLCEGNKCKGGKKGRRSGHGRMILMRRVERNGSCVLKTIQEIKLPREANFQDYSGMAMGHGGRIAVTSQEDAALFVAVLKIDENWQVSFDDVRVLDFPRGKDCSKIFCNVEGVGWLDDGRVIVVSDSMKGGGRQDFVCRGKDEMIHFLALPT